MGKRNFRGQKGAGGKKKRRKISLEKISKLSKERIEREKRRHGTGYKDTPRDLKPAVLSSEVPSSSDEEEEEEQQISSYQELLTNLGARKSAEEEIFEDEEEEDDEEEDLEELDEEDEGEIEEAGSDGGDEEGLEEEGEDEDDEKAIQLGETGSEEEDEVNSDVENIDQDVEAEEEEEDEEEEEGESEENESSSSDEEDDEKHKDQSQDPFFKRVNHELEDKQVDVLNKGKPNHKFEIKWPCLGKCQCSYFEEKSKADVKVCQQTDFRSLHIPKRVSQAWKETNSAFAETEDEKNLSPLQQEMFTVMNSYQDLVYPERTHENAEELRLVYCLHVLSHIIKSRNQVQKHNSMLTADPDLDTESMRDQGLTRPRVLILVPFRNSALEIVKTFAKILIPGDQQMSHRKRFFDEYGEEKGDGSKLVRPEDWEETFAGNIDDHFRLGLSITRKGFRLYSTFYMSDIIIASPLGLRTVIGSKGEDHHEYDFLSSIELLVMDQTDVFLMQNWDHVMHIMDHLHLQPKDSHDVDFSRVRMWALNKWNKFYRQTLIFSAVSGPEINSLVSKYSANWAGRVSVSNMPSLGTISQVAVQLPQVFHRIDCDSFSSSHDKRFQFFITKILPQYREDLMSGTMIFIPSYFDFVRVRNYFRKQEINFAQICEYTSQSNISRARLYMMKGTRHTLLLTERFHFFRRYKIRGIRHIVFYQLPTHPHFYSELCNMLEAPTTEGASQEHTCSIMYSKYDAQRLGSVVGMQRSSQMLFSEKDVHMFVSGDG